MLVLGEGPGPPTPPFKLLWLESDRKLTFPNILWSASINQSVDKKVICLQGRNRGFHIHNTWQGHYNKPDVWWISPPPSLATLQLWTWHGNIYAQVWLLLPGITCFPVDSCAGPSCESPLDIYWRSYFFDTRTSMAKMLMTGANGSICFFLNSVCS